MTQLTVGDEVRWEGWVHETRRWFTARLVEYAPYNYPVGWAAEVIDVGNLYSRDEWAGRVGMRVYVRPHSLRRIG